MPASFDDRQGAKDIRISDNIPEALDAPARPAGGFTARLFPARALGLLKMGLAGVAAVSLALVAGLALALFSRDLSSLPSRLVATVTTEAGGRLVLGRAEIRYWPQPRIVFDRLEYEHAASGLRVESGRAVLRLGLFDLIDGTLDQPHLDLYAPQIRAKSGFIDRGLASPRGLTEMIEAVAGGFSGLDGVASLRLTIRQARMVLVPEDGGEPTTLEPLDARLRYRAAAGRLDLTARRNSSLQPLELSLSMPTARALDRADPQSASLRLAGFGSRLALTGTLARAPELAFAGKLEASVQDDLQRALGFSIGRGAAGKGQTETRIEGNVSLDPRGGGLESLSITHGDGGLTGIAALRENAGRWGISATLAGDLVDGTATHAALQRLRTNSGGWSRRELDVNPVTGLDLDIRLSTRLFKLGQVSLENVALSVFTRRGRAEFAIADARYAGGTVKARVSIIERTGGQDLRFQLSGDKIESETLLTQAFGLSRLRGLSNFVLQGESSGSSIAELAANLNGSGGFEIRAGMVQGIDANRLMSRIAEIRPEAALLAALGGRTPFEVISTHVAIRNGRIEPVGSNLMAARMIGLLEGAIDLSQQRHDLAIVLRRREDLPPLPSEFFAFRIEGPLFAPQMRPDPTLLARRS